MWKEDGDNLDKSKKFKFSTNLLKIIPRGQQPSIIVFSNGNCGALPYAIDNRKTYESKSILKDSEVIVDAACYMQNGIDYITYVIKNSKDLYEIINCPVRHELGDLERSKISRIKINRPDDVYVVGELISTQDKAMVVYVLWSDSKMSMYDLTKKFWKTIGTIPWISTFNHVSMAWMAKDHLILFGSNMDQDGAIILAYNVVLGVGSCKYPMKMYTAEAKLYCINERIILEASNHIGVLPYVLEIRRNLSRLLGSHEIIQDEETEIVNWDNSAKQNIKVANEFKHYLKQGITERSICAQVIPPLLEKDSTEKVKSELIKFKDVPESVLVQTINYVLKLIDAKSVDLTKQQKFTKFCKRQENNLSLLNDLLKIVYSDALLTFYLREGISLDDALFLMTYITYLLFDQHISVDADFESKLLDWCTLLVDSFYQQYLMTKSQKVTHVLKNTLSCVLTLVKNLHTIDKTMITLHKYLTGKDKIREESVPYSIEMMKI
ncbi:uncharacterized protein LOC113236137 isoform X2 [Hyposmocoma kahamanoa]|nr:uncharacterized protein LOC113236137 isoform X2 [Hyposmocoma kahamanoa]